MIGGIILTHGPIAQALIQASEEILGSVNNLFGFATTNLSLEAIYERIDELEGSNKGFIERLRDAINPHATEPMREKDESKPIEKTEKTLGKVAEVISRCPNFFDWDWCQVNCPLYQLCDNVSTVQDTSKLSQKGSIDRFKEILKQFASSNYLKKNEYL